MFLHMGFKFRVKGLVEVLWLLGLLGLVFIDRVSRLRVLPVSSSEFSDYSGSVFVPVLWEF